MNNKWGLSRATFKNLARLHNKVFVPPYKIDSPALCLLGPDYWHAYPIKEYDYRYNSWGFRGEDYEQYTGQIVNICIGNSNTVNFGGPLEHSWPYLLSQYFDIPTLNLGVDKLSFTEFLQMVDKATTTFKVNKIFVLYNIFENDREPMDHLLIPALNNANIDAKINILKKYCWVHSAYWQFDPPWTFFEEELSCLYEHFPDAHNYLRSTKIKFDGISFNILLNADHLRIEYYKIAGPNWISFEKFCKYFLSGFNILNFFNSGIDQKIINEYLSGWFAPFAKKILLVNRDGWHMSYQVNQALADYFYQQTLIG